MSHDLFFDTAPGAPPLDREAFFAHCQGELYEREGDEVSYSNPDTEVSFRLTFCRRQQEPDAARNLELPEAGRPYLHFSMSYCRPHTFALEADRVLSGLARRFKLVVRDPGGEERPAEYTSEAFLEGWNRGNEAALRTMAVLRPGATDVLTLPADMNRALWEWNFSRDEIARDFWDMDGFDVFVPRVMFYRGEGGLARTWCLFPDLIPTAVPRVDRVLVRRSELSPPYDVSSKATPAWVSWDELRAACAGFEVVEGDRAIPYLLLHREDYTTKDSPPEELARWVISLPGWAGPPEPVTPDEVLDEESVTWLC